jgi:hypothetical protein
VLEISRYAHNARNEREINVPRESANAQTWTISTPGECRDGTAPTIFPKGCLQHEANAQEQKDKRRVKD